jgi:uncharacterized phage protein (TIGR01671 family)
MEDRFKFRAWDGNKMHYKLLIGNTDTKDFENYTAHCLYDYESKQWKNFDEMSDIVIMQCTGLKDKKQNLIYESDIVDLAGYGKYLCEFPFLELYDLDDSSDIGVILGNRFENPELLEGN